MRELGLGGEWEVEKIALEPLSERRNFLLGSYLGIPKAPRITVGPLLLFLSPLPLLGGLYLPSCLGSMPSGGYLRALRLLPLSLSFFREAFSNYQELSAVLKPSLLQRCELKSLSSSLPASWCSHSYIVLVSFKHIIVF